MSTYTHSAAGIIWQLLCAPQLPAACLTHLPLSYITSSSPSWWPQLEGQKPSLSCSRRHQA